MEAHSFFKPRKIKTRRSYKNVRKIWTSCERKWIKLFYETKVDNSLFVFLSPWSTVNTPCNTSCGGGVMMKVRSCTNPRPQGKDGKICEGIDKQYFPCNTEPCDMQVGCGLSNRWGRINSTNFLTSTLMNTKLHKPLQWSTVRCFSGLAGRPAARTVGGGWGWDTPGAPRRPAGSCSSARASSTSPTQRSATPGSRTSTNVPVLARGEFSLLDISTQHILV